MDLCASASARPSGISTSRASRYGLVRTDLGTEVTVTLEAIADLQTVTLTLLVSAINLGEETEARFATVAIETTNHTTIGGPRLIIGPLRTYRVIELNGAVKKRPVLTALLRRR